MKDRTLTLIIGILIGAIVTSAGFLLFNNNTTSNNLMGEGPLPEMMNGMADENRQMPEPPNGLMENIPEKLNNAVDDVENGMRDIGNRAENGLTTVEDTIENGVNAAKNIGQ